MPFTQRSVILLYPLFGAVFFLLASNASFANQHDEKKGNPHVWKPKTKSVSVFKNGFGFFTREAAIALKSGWGHAAEVPPATFGTLAVYSQNPSQLVDVIGVGDGEITRFDGLQAGEADSDKQVALESAMGTKVKVEYRDHHQDLQAIGIVKAISGGFLVLQQDATAAAIPVASIQSMQRVNLPLRFHVVDEQGKPSDSVTLNMAYLRSGIVWIPEYTLKLLDEETAELTLRGTLVNEAEDLTDCEVNFVVGVPHFIHTELLSPVAVGYAIRALGTAMPTAGVPQQVMSQVMNRAAIGNNFSNSIAAYGPEGGAIAADADDGSRGFASLLGQLPQAETVGTGDYSVYTKKGLTVRKGERAVVTLMTKKIRFGHRYHWTVGGDIDHRLVLENSTSIPWTTGPCLALAGSQPLSEDSLRYTPVGGRGELTVTTAINVAKQITESEIDRKLKAHEPSPSQYLDLVTLRGSMKIKSYEKRPIDIRVRRQIQGKPLTASSEGVIATDSERLRLVERSGTIEWNLTLEPGKEIELEYTMERFVSSN